MADEAAAWLQLAEEDLKAVRNNVFGPEPAAKIAAYHCQQAAEKMVKAVLISAGVDPPHWHNIDNLIDLLPEGHRLRPQLEPLGRFSPYAIAFRYPVLDPDVLPYDPARDEILTWLGKFDRAREANAEFIASGQ